jgi:hypothetical protein
MQNPNSLTDKEKAIISDGLSSFAPLIGGMLQPNLNDFSILKH